MLGAGREGEARGGLSRGGREPWGHGVSSASAGLTGQRPRDEVFAALAGCCLIQMGK